MARASTVASKLHATIDALAQVDSTAAHIVSCAVARVPKRRELVAVTVSAGKLTTKRIEGLAALALKFDGAKAVIALLFVTAAILVEHEVGCLDLNGGRA